MHKVESIAVGALLIDTENPRLEEALLGQRDAIRAMAVHQKAKLATLAKDIIENGINPSESLIVMPFEGTPDRYVVLEGNRRLTAIKILESPELISGAVEDSIVNRFRKLSTQYLDSPIESLACVIVDLRADASHWIELRHTGENEGSGIVRWGGAETARFRRRSGQKEPHLQVLDYLEQRGDIDKEVRQSVPVTSLKRLLSTPYVRTKLGVDLKSGIVETRYEDDEVARGLKYIVKDLASGNVRVKDIYRRDDRIRYVDSIPPDVLPDISNPMEDSRHLGTPAPSGQESTKKRQRTRSKSSGKGRATLIPRGFSLSIKQTRINNIYHELRKLDIEEYTNAVAVLFRVFLELGVDEYIEAKKLGIGPETRLGTKLETVADHLRNEGLLDRQQLTPVRRAAQRDSLFAATITTMNQYVHNQYFAPAPIDLRTTWDNLQVFIETIMSL